MPVASRQTKAVRPMSCARARRLVPRDVNCTPFFDHGNSGVILSKNGTSFRVTFTDMDSKMTDAALLASVFKPALCVFPGSNK